MVPIRPIRIPYLLALIAIGLAVAVAVAPREPSDPPYVEGCRCFSGRARTPFKMHVVKEALLHYGVDHPAQCPWSMRVLVDQRYLRRPARDAWGTTIAFTCTSPFSTEHPLVVSAGPDRKFGTPDDIRNDF
jgi:hypothetical protein